MLLICKSLKQLNFSALMAIYEEGNRENGQELYPELSSGQQMLQAEQDFYAYLSTDFFKQAGDLYCIWEENGQYVSALRLQVFADGLLLEALETHPSYRRQGYAKRLILAILDTLQPQRVYSHIGHSNLPSRATHIACGFIKIADHARYADGSVNGHCGTYLYQSKNAGI